MFWGKKTDMFHPNRFFFLINDLILTIFKPFRLLAGSLDHFFLRKDHIGLRAA